MREAGPIPRGARRRSPARLKACPLRLTGVAPIARAISSAGGVAWAEIDERFMLRALPGRVRRRRDDRLGGADRRLSAAGGFFDRRGGGAGRGGVAVSPFLALTRASATRKAPPGRSKLFPSFFQIYPNFSLGISKLFQTFFRAVLSLFNGLRGAQEPIFYFQAFSPRRGAQNASFAPGEAPGSGKSRLA